MGADTIKIYGARVHNLKNIDVEIPRNSLTVITGLSGSGKSSLALGNIALSLSSLLTPSLQRDNAGI